jgi:hypothetical protein
MPRKKYALVKSGPKEIECSWGFAWENFTVTQNGNIIGTIANQRELKEGRQFSLADGSTLSVRLKIGFGNSGLEVLHDGKPLPGSDMDPAQKVKVAFILLLVITGLNLLAGILLSMLDLQSLGLGIGIGYIIFGIIFGVLAFAVRAKSLVSLYIAIALLILDAVAGIAVQVMSNSPTFVWVIVRIFILIYLFSAIKAMKTLKQEPVVQ